MIASIHGQVEAVASDHLIVRVGGVGVCVFVPTTVFEHVDGVGRGITLYTHLVVREDALTLYGFPNEDECALFTTLLSVSGVGPRLALSILSTLSLNLLHRAIAHGEPETLARVPGIGRKTAKKLVFELKDKLKLDKAMPTLEALSDTDADVIDALIALGYSIVEAQAALQSIPASAAESLEERVRVALQYFS
jgi:Holliday junction DNA helicase RuvA